MFTNCYPKTSHSFIRNEIAALAGHGLDVLRITVRPAAEALVDADDVAEARRTVAIMAGGMIGLARASGARLMRSPLRFARTFRLAVAEANGIGGTARALGHLAQACRLTAIMQRHGVRHVHVHFGTNPATIARLAARLSGVSYSLTVHGPDEFDAPVALRLREKVADARFVVAISSFGRSQLLRWANPADGPRIVVLRCGVGSSFAAVAATPPSGRRLVCIARLHPQKGLALLIEAAARLALTERFELSIVGDGEARPALEQQIARCGLGRHVHLLGWRDAPAVQRELLAARALVLPSFAEGLPIVLMEALALGRPAVATAIAGIPELIDATNGWLVRPGCAVSLSAGMKAALSASPATLATMGAAGRARVLCDHDLARNGAALAALLRPFATTPEIAHGIAPMATDSAAAYPA